MTVRTFVTLIAGLGFALFVALSVLHFITDIKNNDSEHDGFEE